MQIIFKKELDLQSCKFSITFLKLYYFSSQYQTETTSIEAGWDVSGDPCPASMYEWAIEQTDGTVLQNYTNMFSMLT